MGSQRVTQDLVTKHMTHIAVEQKSSAGNTGSFLGSVLVSGGSAGHGATPAEKAENFCSLPTANVKSPLWVLYQYSWATPSHFPSARGNGELVSVEDGQAGTLPPVGQGPTFSMSPEDGWVGASRGLAGRVLDSVSLVRLGLCYSLSLSLSEPQYSSAAIP